MNKENKRFNGCYTGKELSRVERNRMLGKELMKYRTKLLREQLKKNEQKKKKQREDNNQSTNSGETE